jgi:hypothetical protein
MYGMGILPTPPQPVVIPRAQPMHAVRNQRKSPGKAAPHPSIRLMRQALRAGLLRLRPRMTNR